MMFNAAAVVVVVVAVVAVDFLHRQNITYSRGNYSPPKFHSRKSNFIPRTGPRIIRNQECSHSSGKHVRVMFTFYPREPHFYIEKLGYARVYLFFLFFLQNIDCGYSLEPPR